MIEVGNGVDFDCAHDAAALARCHAHMTMWCIMKVRAICEGIFVLVRRAARRLDLSRCCPGAAYLILS